jgi:CRISPR-associated protein Cmr1
MMHTYEIEALTDVWTGDVKGRPGRLITTGLLGSIRWWFEVLVRGLGGSVCDPSNTKCIEDTHCVVCEFFGCTGWARKFRFDVVNESDTALQAQIKAGEKFKLRFTPLRHIREKERTLLELTLRLISDHGAVGGKMVSKPTDEESRQGEIHHQDFGLIELARSLDGGPSTTKDALRGYVNDSRWLRPSQEGMSWASLTNFWAVRGQYLARQDVDRSTFNDALKREPSKRREGCGQRHDAPAKRHNAGKHPKRLSESMLTGAKDADRWIAGDQQVSKKIFSFKSFPRTFGFINPNGRKDQVTLQELKERLGAAWRRTIVEEEVAEGDERSIQLLTGSTIIEKLLRAQEAKP